MNTKTFRANGDTVPGHGPTIYIETPEHNIDKHICDGLKELSVWGGNTSNSPEKYSMWEFPSSNDNFEQAIMFLVGAGWKKEEE